MYRLQTKRCLFKSHNKNKKFKNKKLIFLIQNYKLYLSQNEASKQ